MLSTHQYTDFFLQANDNNYTSPQWMFLKKDIYYDSCAQHMTLFIPITAMKQCAMDWQYFWEIRQPRSAWAVRRWNTIIGIADCFIATCCYGSWRPLLCCMWSHITMSIPIHCYETLCNGVIVFLGDSSVCAVGRWNTIIHFAHCFIAMYCNGS